MQCTSLGTKLLFQIIVNTTYYVCYCRYPYPTTNAMHNFNLSNLVTLLVSINASPNSKEMPIIQRIHGPKDHLQRRLVSQHL